MTDAPAATPSPERADPSDQPTAGAAPARSGTLLTLVRGLIDFGNALLSALHNKASDQALANIAFTFGTLNVALIIARITRGLRLATGLEHRLLRAAPRLDNPPTRPLAAPTQTSKRPSPPRQPALAAEADDAALLARLPTAAEIAAQIRHRPIGAVLADICCDLGITSLHPLWRTLQDAVLHAGGDFTRVINTMLDRARPSRIFPPEMLPAMFGFDPAGAAPPLANGTGPP